MAISVAKNAFYLTIASIGQKILSFVYFTLLARTLGVSGTGQYVSALALTTMVSIIADAGFSPALVREVAKTKERAEQLLAATLTVKSVCILLAYGMAILGAWVLQYSPPLQKLVWFAGVVMVLDSLHLTVYAVLRGLQTLRYEARGIFIGQSITLFLGILFIILKLPLWSFICALASNGLFNVLYSSFVLRRIYQIRIRFIFSKEIATYLFHLAMPFALAGIFTRVYSQSDLLLLGYLSGEKAVGWYAVPYKIVFAFQFIPMALTGALYPALADRYVAAKESIAHTFEQALLYLMLLVTPIALGIAFLARDIVLFLYTAAYLPSVVPLQIMALSLFFAFLSFPVGSLLNACNRQKIQTSIMGVTMLCSVLLNYVFIPRYGITGAAVVAFITQALLCMAGFLFVPRIITCRFRWIFKKCAQILVSAVLMLMVLWMVGPEVSLIVRILLAALAYFSGLFFLRVVTKPMVFEMINLLLKRKGSPNPSE